MQNSSLIYKPEVQNLVYNCASVEMQSSSFQERKNLPILHGSVLSSPTTEQGHFSLPIRQSPLQSSRWGGGGAWLKLYQIRVEVLRLSLLSPVPHLSLTGLCPSLKHLNLSLHLQRDQRTQLSRLAKRFVRIFPKPELWGQPNVTTLTAFRPLKSLKIDTCVCVCI